MEDTPDDEVSLVELTALRNHELSADQEARLRMRMAGDSEVAKKLWALDNVHRLFEKPNPQDELPREMPYDVAARLQVRIAAEALRRCHHTSPGPQDRYSLAEVVEDSRDRTEAEGPETPEDPLEQ